LLVGDDVVVLITYVRISCCVFMNTIWILQYTTYTWVELVMWWILVLRMQWYWSFPFRFSHRCGLRCNWQCCFGFIGRCFLFGSFLVLLFQFLNIITKEMPINYMQSNKALTIKQRMTFLHSSSELRHSNICARVPSVFGLKSPQSLETLICIYRLSFRLSCLIDW
jgi:hypothetical protein